MSKAKLWKVADIDLVIFTKMHHNQEVSLSAPLKLSMFQIVILVIMMGFVKDAVPFTAGKQE